LDRVVLIVGQRGLPPLEVPPVWADGGRTIQVDASHRTAPAAVGWVSPDIVLQQVNGDRADDYDTCRAIKAVFDGKLVVVSPSPTDPSREEFKRCGADEVVAASELPNRLEDLVGAGPVFEPIPENGDGVEPSILTAGELALDLSDRCALLSERTIPLSASQFETLWFLARRVGRVVSRDELYRGLLGMEYNGLDRRIDLRISRLRRRLGDVNGSRRMIKSVRHDGYVLATPMLQGQPQG